jgi:acetyl/propionyl-CoA carboxylase alpha subunit
MPTSGRITYLREPGGSGVRVDSALYQGIHISTDYDSLIAKLIVWGEDRATAIRRMIGALEDFQIVGVTTDLSYLREVMRSEVFLSAEMDTLFLEEFQPQEQPDVQALKKEIALAATLFIHNKLRQKPRAAAPPASQWRAIGWREQMSGNF